MSSNRKIKKSFVINGVEVVAHKFRTAVRRLRAFRRGECELNGKPIPKHLRGPNRVRAS